MQVCVIREQRLDQEDVIADISKSCDQAKKEQETLKQKLKRIEQSLAATETDIREFQQEKQASLNEIDVMVMLYACLLYTSPSPRDRQKSRMPSSA